jgi:putative phage-type endonuclease
MARDINDIINLIEKNKIFTTKDLNELMGSITLLFENYVRDNILDICFPNFDEKLNKYIYMIHINQLMPVYFNYTKYRVKFKLINLIKRVKRKLYSKIIPCRSYKKSFIRKVLVNTIHLTEKINLLKNIPQPTQRTEEWYIFRHNLLTASSIWKVLGSQSSQNQLIYEKCSPYVIHKNVYMDSPLHWGQKYEPVSIELYKKLYNTEITDFGCIRHPKYPFIGASPDGINTDISNSRFGRMLEIKNIVSREINGIPKFEYWIQMQIQMETCDLNECDFLETKFIEYDNEEQFLADGTFRMTENNKQKGIMLLFNDNGNTFYEYAPINIDKEEYNKWEEIILNKNKNFDWIRTIYWKLEKLSNILILRNKLWFEQALPKFRDIWEIIIKERETGYEHRAPKKRMIQTNNIPNKCLIQIEKL